MLLGTNSCEASWALPGMPPRHAACPQLRRRHRQQVQRRGKPAGMAPHQRGGLIIIRVAVQTDVRH